MLELTIYHTIEYRLINYCLSLDWSWWKSL